MMPIAVVLQYLLPHRFLSRIVYWATRWRWRAWKDFLIRQIVQRFDVDLSEAETPDIESFEHFNAFFTRALKPGARVADPDPRALLSPADGRISQLGTIRDGRIFQAKDQEFTVGELLGTEHDATPYRNGSFVTVYLSPRDYHRVHMPLAGTLKETVHVPGRLFSVAPHIVRHVPRLFARNERLVCHFEGDHGPFVVILVGAILVSSVSTVWSGLVIPPYTNEIRSRDWSAEKVRLDRFAELGRFNMGSTVIVLFPAGTAQLDASVVAEQAVRVGERLGVIDKNQ
jgi:phosphatidylserine decarboxylase